MRYVKGLILLMLLALIGCVCENNVKDTFNEPLPAIKNGKCIKDVSTTVCQPQQNYIYIIGKGAPPNDENLTEVQRYLLSERAAVIDGYRQLAEKLQGFIVTTLSKSGNYIVNMDLVKVQTESLIRGAEIVEINHNDNGVCTAKIRIQIPNKENIISSYSQYSNR